MEFRNIKLPVLKKMKFQRIELKVGIYRFSRTANLMVRSRNLSDPEDLDD